MELKYTYLTDTKNCYRFENKNGDSVTTLYLKKSDVDNAGINPQNGIIVTIKEDK